MSAVDLLKKAIEFDLKERYMEALKLYQSGIDQLLTQCKAETDVEKKRHFQAKIEQYMNRAEIIKSLVPPVTDRGHIVDKIFIMEGDRGYSYDTVFGKYLDNDVTEISLEEPYVREHYQVINLLKFFELVVTKCRNLKNIHVTTIKDPRSQSDQADAFTAMTSSLQDLKRISLTVTYLDTLHDRQIILNNGYIIKNGRGLNYFKPTPNKYSLGAHNYDMRECKQCNVDIFFCAENKTR